MNNADVVRRLEAVRDRIAGAGGSPDSVTIVGVTKGHDAGAARAAAAAGLQDLGENYAGDLLDKHSDVSGELPGVRWHFLGHVQRNKVRRLAPVVTLWQGVDRPAAGAEIARHAPGASVLVQVNVSGEPAKNGCAVEETADLVARLDDLGLRVRGLMAVGPHPARATDVETRRAYARLVALADRLELEERSIGMSADLEAAVDAGSTMVRVGEALFGPRKARTYPSGLQR